MADEPLGQETDWRHLGACREVDPETFYIPAEEHMAKAICRGCDVRETCLADALRRDEPWGIWGAMNRRQRNKLLRETGMKPGRALGPCDECGRTRYSARYGKMLPPGGVWTYRDQSHGRKLCTECAPADDTEGTDAAA